MVSLDVIRKAPYQWMQTSVKKTHKEVMLDGSVKMFARHRPTKRFKTKAEAVAYARRPEAKGYLVYTGNKRYPGDWANDETIMVKLPSGKLSFDYEGRPRGEYKKVRRVTSWS
jgi:hypothetical protein